MIAPIPTEEEAAAIFVVLGRQPEAHEHTGRALSPWRVAARDPELSFDELRARMRSLGVL